MRNSRVIQNPDPSGLVHKYWKCHNNEMLLRKSGAKELYAQSTYYSVNREKLSGNVEIHSFCYMDNHVHMLCGYRNGVENLSNFMRLAHGIFGLKYNKLVSRSGKVAVERPKTPQVEKGSRYEMEVQFYIEANPLRARMVRGLTQLRNFKYSSYSYYAYGDSSEFTKCLSVPKWYLRLGNSPKQRQKKYRSLFTEYLDKNGWYGKKGERSNEFIKDWGSDKFLEKRKLFVKSYQLIKKEYKDLTPREIVEKLVCGAGPPN